MEGNIGDTQRMMIYRWLVESQSSAEEIAKYLGVPQDVADAEIGGVLDAAGHHESQSAPIKDRVSRFHAEEERRRRMDIAETKRKARSEAREYGHDTKRHEVMLAAYDAMVKGGPIDGPYCFSGVAAGLADAMGHPSAKAPGVRKDIPVIVGSAFFAYWNDLDIFQVHPLSTEGKYMSLFARVINEARK